MNQISEQQLRKATLANENFEALKAAELYGINRALSVGLLISLYGGKFWDGAAFATIAAFSTGLSAGQTYFCEATTAGVVSVNTSAFTAGRIQISTFTTGTAGITAYTDLRQPALYNQNVRLGAIESKLGSSIVVGAVPLKANINTTAVGNIGTGEDDLMTFSLPANSLTAVAGKGLHIKAWGFTANNAATKQVKLFFGTVAIMTFDLTISQANEWVIEADVWCTANNAQDYHSWLMQVGTANAFDMERGALTQTQTAAITIKCTGNATTTDDIKQEGMRITYYN